MADKEEPKEMKIKRGKLEKTRDVFSIIRDFLIILVLIGLVLAIFFFIQFLANIQTALHNGGLVGLLGGSGSLGNLGSLFGSGASGGSTGSTGLEKVKGDPGTCSILSGLQGKLLSGDLAGLQSDMGKLEKTFRKNGWQEQLNTLAEIQSSFQTGDATKAIQLGPSLINSIEC